MVGRTDWQIRTAVAKARTGKRVAFESAKAESAAGAFRLLRQLVADDTAATVDVTRRKVTFPSGGFVIVSAPKGWRGIKPSYVFFD